MALGVGKVSNDRSVLDGVFDEFLPGIFGAVPALAADVIGSVAKVCYNLKGILFSRYHII